jgi:hypothetical protein
MTPSQGNYSLAALAEAAFHRLGDHESLVFEGRTYRSGELFDRACRASSGLVKLGVSAGERVVVLMANCPEVGIAYSAIWRAARWSPRWCSWSARPSCGTSWPIPAPWRGDDPRAAGHGGRRGGGRAAVGGT